MRSWVLFAGWVILAGCNVPGTWKDETIDPDIQSEIGKLNLQIIQGFVTHDPEKIRALGSEKLRNDQKNEVWELVSRVDKAWDSAKFKIKNQFYVVLAPLLRTFR